MNKITVICGALAFKDNRFVLVKEAGKSSYGKWWCPAGHLEPNEDILTAAKREVKEETNLDVKLDGLIGVYEHHNKENDNVIVFVFRASVIGGDLKHLEGELLDARWFTFEEFAELKDIETRNLSLKRAVEDCKNGELIDLSAIKF